MSIGVRTTELTVVDDTLPDAEYVLRHCPAEGQYELTYRHPYGSNSFSIPGEVLVEFFNNFDRIVPDDDAAPEVPF